MTCDICGGGGGGHLLQADDVRRAVANGFDPFRLGLFPAKYLAASTRTAQQAFRDWLPLVEQNQTDWDLCPNCLNGIRPFVSGARPSITPQSAMRAAMMQDLEKSISDPRVRRRAQDLVGKELDRKYGPDPSARPAGSTAADREDAPPGIGALLFLGPFVGLFWGAVIHFMLYSFSIFDIHSLGRFALFDYVVPIYYVYAAGAGLALAILLRLVGASEKKHASDVTVGAAQDALTPVIIMTVFSIPLVITQLPLILAYWSQAISDEMAVFISTIVFNNPFEYDNSVIHAVVTIPSLLVGAVLAKATWDRREWVDGWIKPVIASLAIGPMIGGFVNGLLLGAEWRWGLAFGLLNYLLGLPACTFAVALSLMLSRFRLRGVAFLAVFCSMISTMLITGLSMSKQSALPLTWNSLLFLMVSYGFPSAVSAWVCLRMAGRLPRRT